MSAMQSVTPTPLSAGSPNDVIREQMDLEVDGNLVNISTIRRLEDSPPIVFLHDFGGTKEDYSDIQFQERFIGQSFLAYDSPGHGGSRCSDLLKLSMEFLSSVAEKLISTLLDAEATFYLLGHSIGGLVSLLLAERLSSRVLGFINIKGNLLPEDCFLSRQIHLYPAEDTGEFTNAFLDRARRSLYYGDGAYAAAFRAKVDPDATRPTFKSMVEVTDGQDLLGKFLGLSCPRAFMYGEQFSSLSYLSTLREAGVRLLKIPQAGHSVMYTNPVVM